MVRVLFSSGQIKADGILHFSLFRDTYLSEVLLTQLDSHNDVLSNFYLILVSDLFLNLLMDPFN